MARKYKETSRFLRARHAERTEEVSGGLEVTEEMLWVEHQLQLYWLRTVPGYREVLKERVAAARKREMEVDRRVWLSHRDKDYLGREVEGCG